MAEYAWALRTPITRKTPIAARFVEDVKKATTEADAQLAEQKQGVAEVLYFRHVEPESVARYVLPELAKRHRAAVAQGKKFVVFLEVGSFLTPAMDLQNLQSFVSKFGLKDVAQLLTNEQYRTVLQNYFNRNHLETMRFFDNYIRETIRRGEVPEGHVAHYEPLDVYFAQYRLDVWSERPVFEGWRLNLLSNLEVASINQAYERRDMQGFISGVRRQIGFQSASIKARDAYMLEQIRELAVPGVVVEVVRGATHPLVNGGNLGYDLRITEDLAIPIQAPANQIVFAQIKGMQLPREEEMIILEGIPCSHLCRILRERKPTLLDQEAIALSTAIVRRWERSELEEFFHLEAPSEIEDFLLDWVRRNGKPDEREYLQPKARFVEAETVARDKNPARFTEWDVSSELSELHRQGEALQDYALWEQFKSESTLHGQPCVGTFYVQIGKVGATAQDYAYRGFFQTDAAGRIERVEFAARYMLDSLDEAKLEIARREVELDEADSPADSREKTARIFLEDAKERNKAHPFSGIKFDDAMLLASIEDELLRATKDMPVRSRPERITKDTVWTEVPKESVVDIIATLMESGAITSFDFQETPIASSETTGTPFGEVGFSTDTQGEKIVSMDEMFEPGWREGFNKAMSSWTADTVAIKFTRDALSGDELCMLVCPSAARFSEDSYDWLEQYEPNMASLMRRVISDFTKREGIEVAEGDRTTLRDAVAELMTASSTRVTRIINAIEDCEGFNQASAQRLADIARNPLAMFYIPQAAARAGLSDDETKPLQDIAGRIDPYFVSQLVLVAYKPGERRASFFSPKTADIYKGVTPEDFAYDIGLHIWSELSSVLPEEVRSSAIILSSDYYEHRGSMSDFPPEVAVERRYTHCFALAFASWILGREDEIPGKRYANMRSKVLDFFAGVTALPDVSEGTPSRFSELNTQIEETSQEMFGPITRPTGLIMKASFLTKIRAVLPELSTSFDQPVTIAVVGPSQLAKTIASLNATLPRNVSIILCSTVNEAAAELKQRGIDFIRYITTQLGDVPLPSTHYVAEEVFKLLKSLKATLRDV